MIPYQIIRSARKTIAIQITPKAEVLVRCPYGMAAADICRFVESKSAWIEKHWAAKADNAHMPPFTASQIRDMAQKARNVIPSRVAHFAPIVGVTYGRITIRNQRSRWGSCSGKGNLNFNCLLMLAPPEVLDYVVVHELCHRKEMNHSPHFWVQVEKTMPDYKTRKKWLKEYGSALIARLP